MSVTELQEKVEEFEDFVQSSDIAAMQSTCLFLVYALRTADLLLQSFKCVRLDAVPRRIYKMYFPQ